MTNFVQVVAVLVGAAVVSFSARAEACGCFAPPDSATPIVQAGERILFAVQNGKVTAHIQIQYAGDAKDFGWLLPLPSVPVLKVGTDELFTALLAQTQPTYVVQNVQGKACPNAGPSLSLGCASYAPTASVRGIPDEAVPPPTPLVVRSSVGPYEYAVLKADSKTDMLKWLSDNRFFIPTGTEDVVGPYIRPGSYFLALKLKSGASSGDIAPVVLEYASQLPMIPLILTSVAAQPNMGIQVWVVGTGRAIPRNFHHVVINDAQLEWMNGVSNYAEVVTRAVAEAPDKHAFVTEYAGTSSVMRDRLAPPGRFGTVEALAAKTSPGAFVEHLKATSFPSTAGGPLPAPIKSLIANAIPDPPALRQRGVVEDQFYDALDYYLGDFRTQNPDVFVGYQSSFDAPVLAREIFNTWVASMRETDALFTTFPKLTRLFTTLSPQDMTADPVFSFNPSLPDVALEHTASLVMNCGTSDLKTEQGLSLPVQGGFPRSTLTRKGPTPFALRLETLSEEGPPVVVTDNATAIRDVLDPDAAAAMPTEGCAAVDPTSLALVVLVARLRRRRA